MRDEPKAQGQANFRSWEDGSSGQAYWLRVQDADAISAKPSPSGKDAGKDQVHISDQAKELRRLRAITNEPDYVRQERVERIQQAIDGGTDDVSEWKVGDALIKHVLTDSVL